MLARVACRANPRATAERRGFDPGVVGDRRLARRRGGRARLQYGVLRERLAVLGWQRDEGRQELELEARGRVALRQQPRELASLVLVSGCEQQPQACGDSRSAAGAPWPSA